MFSIGDGHARQGEGETCGVAAECAMDTVVIVDLIKGVPCPWPRLESDTHLVSTGSARPLEDAFRIAQVDLVQWLEAEFGLHTSGRVPACFAGGRIAAGQCRRHQLHLGCQAP